MLAKRILSSLLAFVLLLSNVPLSALASETPPTETLATDETIADETTLLSTEIFATETTVETIPETTEETVPETTVETVPETTEETVPETTMETVPETTEETVPETTMETVPETTEETVPETTMETVPETTEETVPESTEETVPETTVETVPETTAETVPETTEETVPETTEETVPETTVEPEPVIVRRGTCGKKLKWVVTDDATLTITGTGKMYNYSNDNPAPWSSEWLDKLVIAPGVTSIGKYAFYRNRLREVYLPSGLTSIGQYAFCQNSIAKINLPSELTSIGQYAFYQNDFTEIDLPDGLTSIAAHTFEECDLKQIVIPDGVTSIGEYAFHSCDLTQVIIPDSVTSIGAYAFSYCRDLPQIILPKNLTSIGTSFLSECDSLTSVVIPDGITGIPAHTFKGCDNLTNVVLPNSITSIGDYAFAYCPSLEKIQLPSSVNKIGECAFYFCTSLKKITIPEGVTRIWQDTFFRCDNLAEVTLPESLTRIGASAFSYSGLLSVVIPDNVTYIGVFAFDQCPKLKTVYFDDDPKIPDKDLYLDSFAFSSNDSLYCVALPKDLSKVGGHCFSDCIDLEKLIFAGHLPILGQGFVEKSYHVTLYYPEGYKSWENSDLWDTYALWPYDIMPPIVTATNVASTGKPKLTWISYRKNVTYEVYRSTKKDGQYALIASTRKKSYTDTSAKSGRLYYYKVRTSDIFEFGDVVSKYCDLPSPKISTSIAKPSGKPKVSWNAVAGAKEYKVYYSRYENGPFYCFTTTSKTSAIHQKAISAGGYYYKVKAIHKNASASSAFSAVKYRKCSLSRPVIQLSNDAASGNIKIKIERIDAAKSYQIYRSSTGTDGSYRLLVNTKENRYTDTDVIPGEKYYYKVKAIHTLASANSSFSVAKYRTCDLPRPKVKSSNVAATGKIALSWDAVEGAVKYKVYRKDTHGGDFKLLGSTTKTRYINKSSQAGQWYEYKVKAIHSNTAANSALSSYKLHTCDLPQPAPNIALNKKGKPVITWDAIDGAVKYKVYRSTTGAVGSFKLLGSPVGTKYTNTGAVAGTTYYYKVKAIHSNTIANSALSSIVSITAE